MHPVQNRPFAVSPSTNHHEIIVSASTTTNTADTVMKLAKSVGEMLKDIPYVKALAGLIVQIIEIRDEINTTKERSHELINKVLERSNLVLDGLLSVAKSSHKDTITRIEEKLMKYHKLLVEVLSVLKANTAKGMFNRVVNRKSRLSDLEKYNRYIDDFNTGFLTDLVLQLYIGGTPQQAVLPIATALPLLYKPVLPPPAQLMIGRDEEKSRVIHTLLHTTMPAHIAILGGGGMGKTTLALSVLHEHVVLEKFPSRYFISCEGLPSVLSLVGEIANALRILLVNRDAHLIDTIISSFPERSILCLDNLETIWDDETMRLELEELLSYLQLQDLSIIITMRGTQRPSRVSWAKPLLPPLQSLTYDSSKHIFELTCGPVDKFVEKLLKTVNGIPLAISLICALLQEGSESSKSLWCQWERTQSGVLENGGKDRLSNLDTSIHLSVHGPRMQEDPKTIDILAMLSILPDGFPDDERATEELENHLPKGYNLQKALRTMQRVALVQFNTEGESRRLRMLDPVRAFCKQKLETPDVIRDGITSYYVQKIGHCPDVSDPGGHAIIPSELHNIYAVLVQAWKQGRCSHSVANASILFTRWSIYVGNPVEEVISLAIQGVVDLPSFHGTCHSTLGQVYFHRDKLDKAEASFEHAIVLHQQAHNVLGEANDVQNLGEVYLRQNKLDKAEASFECATELHQQVHDVLGEADNVNNLGQVYMRQDKLDKAEASFEHAAELYQQGHSVLGEANSVLFLGQVYMLWHKLDRAEASFKHATELHQQAHYALGEANDVLCLGRVYMQQGKLDEAEEMFEYGIDLHQQAHNVLGEGNGVNSLGLVYMQQDKLDKAETSFEHATELHQKAHNVLGEANTIQNLGQVYMQQEKLDEAEAMFEHAIELHRQAHDVLGEGNDIRNLGEVYMQQNKLDKAEASFEHAAELHRQVHDVLGEANSVYNLGELYMEQDKLDKAEALFEHAIELHQQARSVLGEGNDVQNLGELYMRQGKLDKAESLFEHAIELHKEAHDVLGEADSVHNLGEVYMRQGKLYKAESLFEHAIELHQEAHDVLGEANSVHNLGEVYMQQGKLDKAEASFEHAAELYQQAHNVQNLAETPMQ
ncbi:hypothetical protein DXG01_003271 [Tephrocybe rancida]|nr:hypothetical protein DXG01_003271 [Tephrocybe rancida]